MLRRSVWCHEKEENRGLDCETPLGKHLQYAKSLPKGEENELKPKPQ